MTPTPSTTPFPSDSCRERIADFIHAHRDAIKGSFRSRIAAGDRSFYDSSDFFSTVQRRADQLAALEDSQAARDISRLLHEIMLEALADHARATVRNHRVRESLELDAQASRDNMIVDPPEPRDPASFNTLHLNAEELQLARLRANGLLHRQVAAALGVSAAVIRTRWQRLVGKAHEARSQPGG